MYVYKVIEGKAKKNNTPRVTAQPVKINESLPVDEPGGG